MSDRVNICKIDLGSVGWADIKFNAATLLPLLLVNLIVLNDSEFEFLKFVHALPQAAHQKQAQSQISD